MSNSPTRDDTKSADLAHRDWLSSQMMRAAALERRAREDLQKAEESKELYMSLLAGMEVSLLQEKGVCGKVIDYVGDLLASRESRAELNVILSELDSRAQTTLEALSWARACYPAREVLPEYVGFMDKLRKDFTQRHGSASANILLKGLP